VAGKAEAQRRKIHLKTAKALGIDVRSTLLATADESSNSSAHAVFWCRRTLRMSVYQGRPEVARTSANRRF
jgi:hypothetical protein